MEGTDVSNYYISRDHALKSRDFSPKSRDLGNIWEWERGTVHIFIITKQNKVSLIKLVQSVNVRLREGIKQFLGYFCC